MIVRTNEESKNLKLEIYLLSNGIPILWFQDQKFTR